MFISSNLTNRKTNMITILFYSSLLPTQCWHVERKVTWNEYLNMSKYLKGEGITWKATF